MVDNHTPSIFPGRCQLPTDVQLVLTPSFVAEIGERPSAETVSRVVCGPCGQLACPLNPRFKPEDEFTTLLEGRYPERVAKGEAIVARLTPASTGEVRVAIYSRPSRKNPTIMILCSRDGVTRDFTISVGPRIIRTRSGEMKLESVDQVHALIASAISDLS